MSRKAFVMELDAKVQPRMEVPKVGVPHDEAVALLRDEDEHLDVLEGRELFHLSGLTCFGVVDVVAPSHDFADQGVTHIDED